MKNKLKISGVLLTGIIMFSWCGNLTSDKEQYDSGYERFIL